METTIIAFDYLYLVGILVITFVIKVRANYIQFYLPAMLIQGISGWIFFFILQNQYKAISVEV